MRYYPFVKKVYEKGIFGFDKWVCEPLKCNYVGPSGNLWGIMLRGIHNINVDSKGRLKIPSRFLHALTSGNDQVVMTIDPQYPCLLMYPYQEWRSIEAKIASLPNFDGNARRIQRLLIGHAHDIGVDAQDRVLVPQELREFAHIDKHCVLIGQSNKCEVWSQTDWEKSRSDWLKESKSGQGEFSDSLQNLCL